MHGLFWRARLAAAMRMIAVLALVALAGCFGQPEEAAQEKSPWGACPQWLAGSPVQTTLSEGTITIDVNATEQDGHPLDGYNLQINATGAVELRFFAGERRLSVTVYTDSIDVRPFLRLNDGALEADVFLTAVTHGTAPDPLPLTIETSGLGSAVVTATPWFRVCGVP